MTAATLTLVDFLFARIAEDEERASRAAEVEGADFMLAALPLDVFDGLRPGFPNRVLAECAAKRAIVEAHSAYEPPSAYNEPAWYGDDEEPTSGLACRSCGWHAEYAAAWPCLTIKALVAVYADHPDFDPSWRV